MNSWLKDNRIFRLFWVVSHVLIWSGGMALANGVYQWFTPDLNEIGITALSIYPIGIGTWGIYYVTFYLRGGANQKIILEGEKVRDELYLLRVLALGWLLGVTFGILDTFSNGVSYIYLLFICMNAFVTDRGVRRGPTGDSWIMGIVTFVIAMALFYFMGIWGLFKDETLGMRMILGGLIGGGLGGITSWPLVEFFNLMEMHSDEEARFSVRPLTFITRFRQWESVVLMGMIGLFALVVLNIGFRPCGKFDLIVRASKCRAEFDITAIAPIETINGTLSFAPEGHVFVSDLFGGAMEFQWMDNHLKFLSTHTDIAQIQYSRQGNYYALDQRDEQQIEVYSTQTERLLFVVGLDEGYSKRAHFVFSEDEKFLAISFWDSTKIQIWSLQTETLLGVIEDLAIPHMDGVAMAPSGKQVAVLSEQKIKLFEPDGSFLREFDIEGAPDNILFAPNGEALLLGRYDELFVFDLRTNSITARTHATITNDFLDSPVFAKDHSYILVTTRWQAYFFYWPNLTLLKKISLTRRNTSGGREIAISPDGQYFVTGHAQNLQIWEIPNLEP